MSTEPRYTVAVRRQVREVSPTSAFDPPESVYFTTVERAEVLCNALNKFLGYMRFEVLAVSTGQRRRPSATA
jgi:hypothetical protein